MESNKKFCKFCGGKIDSDAIVCINCGRQLETIKREAKVEQNEFEEKEYDEHSQFYAQAWFMGIMLALFAPVGIFLMWKFHPEMKQQTKIMLTVIFAILFLIV